MNCGSSEDDEMKRVVLSMGVSSLSHVTEAFMKFARLGSKVTLQVRVTDAPCVLEDVIMTDGVGTGMTDNTI